MQRVNHERVGVAILVLGKIDMKTRNITRGKEEYFIVIKVSIN